MRVKRIEFPELAAAAWAALALIASAMPLGLINLSVLSRVRLCLFRLLTGVPCPGCGMTRALLAAFQGRWQESVGHHPLGIPLLAVWTAWLANGVYNERRGREFSSSFPGLASGAPGAAILALILSVYALRGL